MGGVSKDRQTRKPRVSKKKLSLRKSIAFNQFASKRIYVEMNLRWDESASERPLPKWSRRNVVYPQKKCVLKTLPLFNDKFRSLQVSLCWRCSCTTRYLYTCSKNDVISSVRKHNYAEIRFRSAS